MGVRTPQGRGARRRGGRRRRPVERRARRPHRRLAAGQPSWGVNVELRLTNPPRHSIEEAGIEGLKTAGGAPGPLFSIVTRGGVSALGSTFLPEQPEPAELAPALLERGTRFVPCSPAPTPPRSAPARAPPAPTAARCSARSPPEGLFVATGHGPWGVSLGPGSARLVADAVPRQGGDDPAGARPATRF